MKYRTVRFGIEFISVYRGKINSSFDIDTLPLIMNWYKKYGTQVLLDEDAKNINFIYTDSNFIECSYEIDALASDIYIEYINKLVANPDPDQEHLLELNGELHYIAGEVV